MNDARDVQVEVGVRIADVEHSASKQQLNPKVPLPRILVVEDERIVALDLAATLKQLGYTVSASVSSGEAAIELAVDLRPKLVLMDIRLAGELDGIQAAEAIRRKIDIPIWKKPVGAVGARDPGIASRERNTASGSSPSSQKQSSGHLKPHQPSTATD